MNPPQSHHEKLLNGLNPSQSDAVKNIDGPLMVLAGAGSGKTRTLVTRIEFLIRAQRVSPSKILALTFSNKAAKEMRERVASKLNLPEGALQLTTFHSFCARLLRKESKYLGLSKSFSIYDSSESKTLAKAVLSKNEISPREFSVSDLLYYIEGFKNAGHYLGQSEADPFYQDLEDDPDIYSLFEDYEKELRLSNALDFGGLLTATIELFDKHPEILEAYRKRFQYVLVDEYQDTNRAQFKIMYQLTQGHRNVCVVGDEDQSIYSWRGADIRNIIEFEEFFPETRFIKLEQNYRSSKNIIEAAGHVIRKNQHRKGKDMWTDNEPGEDIEIHEFRDERQEAQFVSEQILEQVKLGTSHDDIAVFYRTNAQSRLLEEALRIQGIPYRVVAGTKFYDRKEIKDMISYLKVVSNPKDSLAITRVINNPTRGIGTQTMRKIENFAISGDKSLWQVFLEIKQNNIDELSISARAKKGIISFCDLIESAKRSLESGNPLGKVFQYILDESGYYENLKKDKNYESKTRLENLDELYNAITQYESVSSSNAIEDFLEYVGLDDSKLAPNGPESQQGLVSLMTIHSSKGLEYPIVFVTGMEENIFPSYMSIDDEYSLEEERRLFYVAMTRAMKKLYISFAQGRMLHGKIKFNEPSRFLYEIPESFYTWYQQGIFRDNNDSISSASASAFSFNQDVHYDEYRNRSLDEKQSNKLSSSMNKNFDTYQLERKFKQGQNVRHKLFGAGKIVSVSGIGDSEKIEVTFNQGETKKFLVKHAPIQTI